VCSRIESRFVPTIDYALPVRPEAREEEDRCIALLRDLIRIPTVNRGRDGGDEKPAAECVADFLRQAGVEPKLYEAAPGRTSVVARVKGTGALPPLLLNAHLDVVEADASRWKHDPFKAELADGYVWGRGAIDMKHMAAMSACVMGLLAKGAAGERLERDVIFAAVADEEAGCDKGSRFLVNEHPDAVRAEFMLGEIGAFSTRMAGRTFYPIQVAEKGMCWVRATFAGEPGHGSMPNPDSAVLKLARAVARLGKTRLPVHPTAVVRRFAESMAAHLPEPHRTILRKLSTPLLAGIIVDWLIQDPGQKRTFSAILSNTASPTVLSGGAKVNVIPSRASIDIDGRILPGQTEQSFLAELVDALGEDAKDAKLDVLLSHPPVETSPDTALFRRLSDTVRRHDPAGIPVPFLIPGFTDASAYAHLGTKCYGFSPVRFDPNDDVSFTRMFHGDDERVPVDGLRWGLRVLFDAVSGFACSGAA
jgi:acetylornithine deacetylase/succinyl-diaminopimelate desuccinylase-like protein